MGLFSHRIRRESLKPGDHIYTYRGGGIYAHHGIYVGDDEVIHFTRQGQKPSFSCSLQKEGFGIVTTCLKCFLSGGNLRRYEYGVGSFLFLAKVRGGTCTMAESDPDKMAIHRAKYLLAKGFGCYNLFFNNCENFAIYCKTGIAVVDNGTIGQSGQVASLFAGLTAAVSSGVSPVMGMIVLPMTLETMAAAGILPLVVLPTSLMTIIVVASATATVAFGFYCGFKYETDIGVRSDAKKISVEDL